MSEHHYRQQFSRRKSIIFYLKYSHVAPVRWLPICVEIRQMIW